MGLTSLLSYSAKRVLSGVLEVQVPVVVFVVLVDDVGGGARGDEAILGKQMHSLLRVQLEPGSDSQQKLGDRALSLHEELFLPHWRQCTICGRLRDDWNLVWVLSQQLLGLLLAFSERLVAVALR